MKYLAPVDDSYQHDSRLKDILPAPEPDFQPNSPWGIIRVCEPTISSVEKDLVNEGLDGGWVSNVGPHVQAFEEEFAAFCQVQYCSSMNSGTSALELVFRGLDLKPGDEVIVPDFTMAAGINAVVLAGGTPVFVDADPETFHIDPTKLKAAITDRTKAIEVTHLYGHPADMDPILKIAGEYNLTVVEDAAEAHGAEYHGKRAGSLGHIACFSFFANKIFTCGEGGAITTDDEGFDALMRRLRKQGYSPERHFWHRYLGSNYVMSNMQASVVLGQLRRADELINARRSNAVYYSQVLETIPGIEIPIEKPGCKHVQWMYGIRVTEEFPVSRDELRAQLAAKGIETRNYFVPMHLQPLYFKEEYIGKFPVSENLCATGFYLPSSSHLQRDQLDYVLECIVNIAGK